MAGKVTPIEGVVPEPKLREVVSYELSPMFRSVGGGERYNPDDLASRRGLRIYSAMMTDEQVKAVMVFKRDAITSRGWVFSFDEGSSLSADERRRRITVYQKIIERMRGSFEDALNGIAKGRQYGFSMTEVIHDVVNIDGRQYVGLNSLLPRDPTTFTFYTDPYGAVERVRQKVAAAELDIDLQKFIHYVHAPEEDPIYGQSDLRQAYRAWYVKDQIIKLYATFLERFAGGFAVMKLDGTRQISPDSKEYTKLRSITENIRNMAGMILPPGVDLDVVMPSTTGEYREALNYFDVAIAKSLLVPNLLGLSHTGETGSYSQSQTQLEAFFWTLNADSRRLEATLQEQLFKPLGDMNWGDGEYPQFHFKPASQDHVKWLVGTWSQLVGAKAVETTAEDEAHLRRLLEMPSRRVEEESPDQAAVASDPNSAFDSGQITAMLEILAKVRDGSIPAETAVELLITAYPMSREDATRLVAPIQVAQPAMPPSVTLPVADVSDEEGDEEEDEDEDENEDQPQEIENARSLSKETEKDERAEGSDEKAEALKFRIKAHTPTGHPRTVSMAAFQKAAARVDFSVIERRSTVIAEDGSEMMSRLVARSTNRALGDDAKIAELIDDDMTDIEYMKLDGADVGKIKAAAKEALAKGWAVGIDSARRELSKAGRPSKTSFADLRDRAGQYFEANGFRMAANVSDGIRAIIQQELIQAVKDGLRVDVVKANIFRRLIDRGFTTLDAVEREVPDSALIETIRSTLDLNDKVNVASYLDTLIRTNTFEALNEARYAEYTDPALEGFVEALEYSAILDDNTTDICRELDGKVYAADAPEWDQFRPPNHFNCRSVLIPVTQVDDWSGQQSAPPTVQPADGFGRISSED